jgi:small subunit ribosomal protein S2
MAATTETETLLAPLEQYLASGIHIGTKFRTKHMEPFIYKVNPNGLCVLNVQEIDRRIGLAAKIIAKYNPEDILVVCRRENGWKAVKAFAKVTNVKFFAGRYPAGIITNPNLETFFEPKLMVVVDPWPDKNAVHDGIISGIPIVALCDTNNTTENVDYIIPCNNKGSKSLGLIFYILANKYLQERGLLPKDKVIEMPPADFVGE